MCSSRARLITLKLQNQISSTSGWRECGEDASVFSPKIADKRLAVYGLGFLEGESRLGVL